MGGKRELGMQELNGGILATDGTRNEHGLRRGTKMCPAGSCGRSIIRRGEFHEPHSCLSVFNPWPIISLSSSDCGLRNLRLTQLSSFFPPNCLPWVRRCALPMVGSRWYGNQRRMRSRHPTTETGQPKLRNSRMGLVELAPPTKKAKPGAGDSSYPRIVRNARNGENAKPPVRNERQQTKSDHVNSSQR
jgi:hypothetical protein